MRPTVYIVDSSRMFCDAVAAMLHNNGYEVAGSVHSTDDLLRDFAEGTPASIVILDVMVKGSGSFAAAREIKRRYPSTIFVYISSSGDVPYLQSAMELGAAAFVLKTSPASELLEALTVVRQGHPYLTPSLVPKLIHSVRRKGSGLQRAAELTDREQSVLKMLAEGLTVKEIANCLDRSVKTVEAHKCNLMRKLDLHNKSQLVMYAIRNKIIDVVADAPAYDAYQVRATRHAPAVTRIVDCHCECDTSLTLVNTRLALRSGNTSL